MHELNSYELEVCGQMVSLAIDGRLYDPKNRNLLSPDDYFAQGAKASMAVTLLHGKRRRAFVDEDQQQLVHYRGKAGSHIIRRLSIAGHLISCMAPVCWRIAAKTGEFCWLAGPVAGKAP